MYNQFFISAENYPKKKLKKQDRLEQAVELRKLVESQHYSIDNFQLFDRNPNTQLLSTNNSFIKFNGKVMILQTSYTGVDGISGLGGMPLQDRVIAMK